MKPTEVCVLRLYFSLALRSILIAISNTEEFPSTTHQFLVLAALYDDVEVFLRLLLFVSTLSPCLTEGRPQFVL